jgi:hypothetical protein
VNPPPPPGRTVEVFERPDLRGPAVLVVMLQGWIDASSAALGAIAALEEVVAPRTIARFDRDMFIDYRARRPTMELRDGRNERLIWPDIELKHGTGPIGEGLLLLVGHEPDSNWHAFARSAVDLCCDLGVQLAVGLGAYPFATPHTRPPRVSCTSTDDDLLARVELLKNSVDVPAGMEAVLEHSFAAAGVPAMGLWAQVPHYIAGMSYPAASAALLDALGAVTGIVIDTAALRTDAVLQRARLDALVEGNDEHRAMLRQLEQLHDSQESAGGGPAADPSAAVHPSRQPIDPSELPSGDELAAEVERYLRNQGSD